MTDIVTNCDENIHRFSDEERRGVYRAIYSRRDVRSQFTSAPISDALLARLLDAAHHAPSVGFMQPWIFIIIRDLNLRHTIHENFTRTSLKAAESYQGKRRLLYDT
ncbi:MAG: nitroreductase family protein, partial [Acidobacteriota bacterium]